MSFITYKGNNIAYQLSGTRTGIPIVFVHGFCSDSRIWDEFKPDFEEDRPVVCIDLPGFGSSALIPDVSIEDMAQTVKLVLDQLGITNCIYVGHSMGGYVGMAFAKKYAAQLKGLVMFHSHPFSDSTDQRANRQKVINFIKRQGHVLYAKQALLRAYPGANKSVN
ncbi:MAG: alpha/beta fold hydrolase, partial [Bacteroidota bacterium]